MRAQQPGRLSPAQVHQITEELAKTAADAAPKDSLVKSRRARGKSAGAGSEEIYIALRGAGSNMQIVKQKLEGLRRGTASPSLLQTWIRAAFG
jgi:hypothetical protein